MKCSVKFQTSRLGPSAVLFDAQGRSINAINYPKGTKLTAKDKERAKKLLQPSCRALRRGLSEAPEGDKFPGVLAAAAAGLLAFAAFQGTR
jgi:hypothetical protein